MHCFSKLLFTHLLPSNLSCAFYSISCFYWCIWYHGVLLASHLLLLLQTAGELSIPKCSGIIAFLKGRPKIYQMEKAEEMVNSEHLIKIPIPEASVSLFIVNYDFIDIAHFLLIPPAKPVKYILDKSEIILPSHYYQIKKNPFSPQFLHIAIIFRDIQKDFM